MKKLSFIIFGLLLFLNCAKEKESKNKIFNPFKVSENVQNQIFDLDTIQLKEIIGKHGTKIYFHRNSFDVNSTDKISLELKELYNLSDLIKSNTRTVTNENELLESSGVIYLNFKSNGEDIYLKDSSRISVRFPFDLKAQERIFNGETDSIGQTSWSITESYFTVFRYDKTYGIDIGHDITLDSLPYYKELWRKQDSVYEKTIGSYENIEKSIGSAVSLTNLGWINVDRFVEQPTKMDFSLTNSLEIDGIIIYVVYDNLNSFTSYYPDETKSIILTDIPILEGTSLIAVGIKDKQLFAQKMTIEEKETMSLSLKPIIRTELDRLFKK